MHERHARVLQRRRVGGIRRPADDNGALLPRSLDESRGQGQSGGRVEHDARGGDAGRYRRVAHREQRIVRTRRADTDCDAVGPRTKPMYLSARIGTGEPPALPRVVGQRAVERQRELQLHE